MIIKQSKQLEYLVGFNAFFTLKPEFQTSISFINMFFLDAFAYLKRGGDLIFMQKIEKILKYGMGFENVRVTIDNFNNLVYISEVYYDREKQTTDEIEKMLDEQDEIELCKIEFLNHVVLTKENFIHIILSWDKALNQLSPLALLYQDDKNWYDLLPFDSKEAMEKFIVDHTKPEII